MVVSDVDLDLLCEQRVNGTVIPLMDLIKDAYDRVFHYTDQHDEGEKRQAGQFEHQGPKQGHSSLLQLHQLSLDRP